MAEYVNSTQRISAVVNKATVMRNIPPETLIHDMPSEDRGVVNEDHWRRAF